MLNNFHCRVLRPGGAVYDSCDSVAIFLCRECAEFIDKLELPAEICAALRAYIARYEDVFTPEKISRLTFCHEGRLLDVFVAGFGEGKKCTADNLRRAAGAAARALRAAKAEKAVLAGPILLNPERENYLRALIEGIYLGSYTFEKFKSEPKAACCCEALVVTAVLGAEKIEEQAFVAAQAVCAARDLVNNPGNVVDPEYLAELALELGRELPVEVDILEEAEMEAKGMNAILAVGQGSHNRPRIVTVKYNGAGEAPYTAFVGKGITFDSGGISIKPAQDMGEMKDDMTGAAAVLYAVVAAARLGLTCNLIGVLACAENMPGGRAQRPGDIVRAASGKTIEVVNTDAEGRMVLADAVWYACRLGAKTVIDIATLTGAVIVALGNETSGIIANDEQLVGLLRKAGHLAGENYWQLPSLPECREALKSDVADLLNSTGRAGGCITGGLFIGEFVDAGVPWAHLDIGGTATAAKTAGVRVKGGTAFGTLTLIRYAELLSCK